MNNTHFWIQDRSCAKVRHYLPCQPQPMYVCVAKFVAGAFSKIIVLVTSQVTGTVVLDPLGQRGGVVL